MLERKRHARRYSLVSGEDADVELGENIRGSHDEDQINVDEELENWDENAEDWDDGDSDSSPSGETNGTTEFSRKE